LQLRSTKGDALCGQRVKKLTVAGVALALMGGLGVVAHADTVIYDHFDNVGAGNSLDGRLAIVSNGNQWVGQTVAFKGNGAGGVSASTAAGYNRTVSIDLGSGFLGSNPGVYDLSLDMRHPAGGDSTSLSWVALGFMKDSDLMNNMVGNNGAPWLLYRYNGGVNVYAGPGISELLLSTSAPTGASHNFKLELDTTKTKWTLNAFLDGAQLDLTAGAGMTYEYVTNPTPSRYVGMSTGLNGPGDVGTVDNFLLTQAVPLPQTAAMALVGFGGLLVTRRAR
jgi:hypothetical protein